MTYKRGTQKILWNTITSKYKKTTTKTKDKIKKKRKRNFEEQKSLTPKVIVFSLSRIIERTSKTTQQSGSLTQLKMKLEGLVKLF